MQGTVCTVSGRAEKATGVMRKPRVSKVRKPLQVQSWRDTGRRHCCWCPQDKGTWRATWEELEPLKLANMHLRQKGRGRNILVYLCFHPPISCQCLPLSKSIRKPADTEAGTCSLYRPTCLQFRTERCGEVVVVVGAGRRETGLWGEQFQMAQCPTSHHSTP